MKAGDSSDGARETFRAEHENERDIEYNQMRVNQLCFLHHTLPIIFHTFALQ